MKNNEFISINDISKNFSILQKLVFEKLFLEVKNIQKEVESGEYKAFTFYLNTLFVIYREAKITPNKIGQFVTLWKRATGNEIEPFHSSDNFDFVMIGTRKENQFGQFIFPKSILIEKGVISSETKEGKRGFRVYSPWDLAENKQAIATQKWQLEYFLTILENEKTDLERAKELF